MQILITSAGQIRCVYGETIDLAQLGPLAIRRGSFVEPDLAGQWLADLAPVNGPVLGPYVSRRQALAAEEQWLTDHWLALPSARST